MFAFKIGGGSGGTSREEDFVLDVQSTLRVRILAGGKSALEIGANLVDDAQRHVGEFKGGVEGAWV